MTLDQFITGVLQGLGLPDTAATRGFFRGLAAAEGTTATNNPFATSRDIGRGETKFNSHGVKNYLTPEDGIRASVETFKLRYYKDVIRRLRADDLQGAAKALALSPYVGGSQAARDRHAANIVRNAGNADTPALSGQPAAGAPTYDPDVAGYRATLGPTADRSEVATSAKVLEFGTAVAQWYGRSLVIGTGTNHRQYVIGTDRESEHWKGNAADTPAEGDDLTRLGQAALIAAGMPPEVARTKTGGVFNVNGYNILFNTDVGGNHYNHLHFGVGKATAPPVYATEPMQAAPSGVSKVALEQDVPNVVFPFEDPTFSVPFAEPGTAQIPSPQKNLAETWKLIGAEPYADPDTRNFAELIGA